jgi:hypothetical protein
MRLRVTYKKPPGSAMALTSDVFTTLTRQSRSARLVREAIERVSAATYPAMMLSLISGATESMYAAWYAPNSRSSLSDTEPEPPHAAAAARAMAGRHRRATL